MRPHSGARRFKQSTKYPHQRSEGLRGRRGTFAEAAARQGLPETLEDPSAADRVALLILSKEV
jgi:hypothetical protein